MRFDDSPVRGGGLLVAFFCTTYGIHITSWTQSHALWSHGQRWLWAEPFFSVHFASVITVQFRTLAHHLKSVLHVWLIDVFITQKRRKGSQSEIPATLFSISGIDWLAREFDEGAGVSFVPLGPGDGPTETCWPGAGGLRCGRANGFQVKKRRPTFRNPIVLSRARSLWTPQRPCETGTPGARLEVTMPKPALDGQ